MNLDSVIVSSYTIVMTQFTNSSLNVSGTIMQAEKKFEVIYKFIYI
jgi:hypothetical protein